MPTTTMSSRQFNTDVAAAKRAAKDGPVVVTDRGEPAFVLLTHDAYRRLAGEEKNIVELLRDAAGADIDFEPVKFGEGLIRPADLN